MEKFFHKSTLIGIRVRNAKNGTVAITEEGEPLQALVIQREAGDIVKPHIHRPTKRTTESLQECIVVIFGKIRIDLFGSGKKVVKRVTLNSGDLFISVSGGHSVTFLTRAKIYEIKNGPFKNDRVGIV